MNAAAGPAWPTSPAVIFELDHVLKPSERLLPRQSRRWDATQRRESAERFPGTGNKKAPEVGGFCYRTLNSWDGTELVAGSGVFFVSRTNSRRALLSASLRSRSRPVRDRSTGASWARSLAIIEVAIFTRTVALVICPSSIDLLLAEHEPGILRGIKELLTLHPNKPFFAGNNSDINRSPDRLARRGHLFLQGF